MVDLTFRTLGAWGAGKGANLAPAEVDNNFWSLAQAIFDLQNDPAVPNGIASISVSGTQMTITLHDGTVLGPYTLPTLVMRWRGEWQPSTICSADVFTVPNRHPGAGRAHYRHGLRPGSLIPEPGPAGLPDVSARPMPR
jgi:hypothetical protein